MKLTNSEVPERPLMTMRVSLDSGRTWSPVREVWPDQCDVAPWSLSDRWPLCQCPRHRSGAGAGA